MVSQVHPIVRHEFLDIGNDADQIVAFVVHTDCQKRSIRSDGLRRAVKCIQLTALNVHLDEGRLAARNSIVNADGVERDCLVLCPLLQYGGHHRECTIVVAVERAPSRSIGCRCAVQLRMRELLRRDQRGRGGERFKRIDLLIGLCVCNKCLDRIPVVRPHIQKDVCRIVLWGGQMSGGK